MGTIWVQEFTGGLDTRRLPEATVGGVLITARNGHITRGGEFEKRAAFVEAFTLPPGSVGLAFDLAGPVVFGSLPTLSVPIGVRYQRLVGFNEAAVLSRVPSTDLFAGKLYVVGVFSDGTIRHFYDGQPVTDWFDGRSRFSFGVRSGASGGQVTSITVDGVAIIGAAVPFAGTLDGTASAIANAINNFASTPEYTAVATGTTVSVSTTTADASANNRQFVVTVGGALNIAPTTGVLTSGSSDAQLRIPGLFVRTVGTKMYSVSGPNLHYSGIQAPTKWTTDTVGAGFTDFSALASGFEQLYAVAEYQNFVAVFAERATKIQYVDPDPTLNKTSQTLRNTGTSAARSVTQFGDSDVFYLDESGLRSLRARDASNAASTSDVGVPIDALVTAKLSSLDLDERAAIIGLIEPRDGRFWLVMKDVIYVFSFFSGAKVSAWTTYEPGFAVDDAGVFQRRVYLRSGNSIYVYGGVGAEPVYDASEAEARLVYLDAGKPTTQKRWEGLDAAVRGEWAVSVGMEPNVLETKDDLGIIFSTTFNLGRIPLNGASTHISPIFRSRGAKPATLASVVLQFANEQPDAKD